MTVDRGFFVRKEEPFDDDIKKRISKKEREADSVKQESPRTIHSSASQSVKFLLPVLLYESWWWYIAPSCLSDFELYYYSDTTPKIVYQRTGRREFASALFTVVI